MSSAVIDSPATVILPTAPSGRRSSAPRTPRTPRPPKPPRRMPTPPRQPEPLTRTQLMVRGVLSILAALLIAFVLDVTVLSQVQHLVAQQRLSDQFSDELLAGTAPVAEGDFDDNLVVDGAPLGILSIPQIGVKEVFVEGTSSTTLTNGPGHRRDTVLPGQAGVSVLMARASSFGGPFGRIQELAPGDKFTVRTGQGLSNYVVIGVRYAGDPVPAAPTSKQSRLILETARGAAFQPSGVAYVDAQLATPALAAGPRQTTQIALPPQDLAMASDPSTIWALIFALQFLLVVEIGAVWAYRRIGAQKTWIVFFPLSLLAMLYVTNQVTILLPNLL